MTFQRIRDLREDNDLKQKDLFFLTGGYKIKRTATLEENRIEDNSVILICEFVD